MAEKTRAQAFEDALTLITSGIDQAIQACLTAARIGLEHFVETGDVIYLNRMYLALQEETVKGKRANFIRVAPFRLWLIEVAPVELKDGKFVKDKSRDGMTVDIDAALRTSPWDRKPAAREPQSFTAEELMTQVLRLVKRLKSEGYKPANKAAAIRLQQLEKAVTDFQALPYPQELENEPTDQGEEKPFTTEEEAAAANAA